MTLIISMSPYGSRSVGLDHVLISQEEDEIGRQLDSGDWIGDAAGPEFVPRESKLDLSCGSVSISGNRDEL